jgi:hypothetical protein
VKFNFQVAPHEMGRIDVAATVLGGQVMYQAHGIAVERCVQAPQRALGARAPYCRL